ncbi:LAMI_0D04390g1_1 [Lachancea mirantina]|uniref:LAMI_0D04390g1_1 n=1 Tax=Lachancea mirantina TaxID=1230905 RepID=A0A1G4JAH9_9SACH|nr:LAMI_0D04390g1_1 [Lachancea mirantina]
MGSSNTSLITNNDQNNRDYSTISRANETGYLSDGRSVSSDETCGNRFRFFSPDYEDLEGNIDDDDALTTSISKEISHLLYYSVPITITFCMEYLLAVTSLFILGHLGKASDLASASLAVMTFNITGLAVIEGMSSALDTLCPQAFGAQKYTRVGLYFQRCTAMILIAAIPICISWWTCEKWLQYLVPEKDLLANVQVFLRITSLALPGLIFFETGKRFVQAQGIFDASTWVLVFNVPLNIVISIFLTKRYGFVGAPIAITITYWLMAIILFLYCLFFVPTTKQCWYPVLESSFHLKRVFSNWGPIWRLAFPGLVMIESEYLSFEVLTVMSTHFGVRAIAAQSVIANLGSLIYQIPFAMGCVVATRIANYIGSGLLRNAGTTVKASWLLGAIIGITNCLLIMFGKRWLCLLFTRDKEIIEVAARALPILALNQLCDGLATFNAAILRAQGRQALGGLINVINYYFIALPLSYWFAFGPLHLELKGLWYGCGVGIFLMALCLMACVRKSNWGEILQNFIEREEREAEIDMDSIATG